MKFPYKPPFAKAEAAHWCSMIKTPDASAETATLPTMEVTDHQYSWLAMLMGGNYKVFDGVSIVFLDAPRI